MATDLVNALSRLGLSEMLRLRLVQQRPVASPAAGANLAVVVPAGVIWELLGVHLRFTASAVVATRTVAIIVTDMAGIELLRAAPAGQVTASLSILHDWIPGQGAIISSSGYQAMLGTPPPVLFPGQQLQTSVASIDVGDQIGNVVLIVREWSPDQISKQARWIDKNVPTDILIDQGAE